MLLTAAILHSRGFSVIVGYRHPVIRESAERAGLPHLHLHLKNDADFISILHIARYVKENQLDIIIPTRVKEYWLGTLGAKLAGIKCLIFLGIVREIQNKWKNRKLYGQWADGILLNAEAIRETLLQSRFIQPEKLFFLPNGIKLPEELSPFRSTPRPFKFIYVGSLIKRKNVSLLLECFKQLLDENPALAVELEYIGDGPEKTALENLARRLNLTDRVKFQGHQNDVVSFLLKADALVLLSENEGFPNSVVEAMAYGVPVLVTRVAGIGEVLRHKENALLVNVDADQKTITGQMRELVLHPEIRERLRENAFRTAVENFSLEKTADILENQIRSVLDG